MNNDDIYCCRCFIESGRSMTVMTPCEHQSSCRQPTHSYPAHVRESVLLILRDHLVRTICNRIDGCGAIRGKHCNSIICLRTYAWDVYPQADSDQARTVRSQVVALVNYGVMHRIQFPMYVESNWSLYTTVQALALLSSDDCVQDTGPDRSCSFKG